MALPRPGPPWRGRYSSPPKLAPERPSPPSPPKLAPDCASAPKLAPDCPPEGASAPKLAPDWPPEPKLAPDVTPGSSDRKPPIPLIGDIRPNRLALLVRCSTWRCPPDPVSTCEVSTSHSSGESR